jgi:hypothetical protein
MIVTGQPIDAATAAAMGLAPRDQPGGRAGSRGYPFPDAARPTSSPGRERRPGRYSAAIG